MAAEILSDLSRATDNNSAPIEGAQWFFYATGTLTPQAVYTTAALDVAHANPVVADAAGRFPQIYFDASLSYRGILKNAAGTTQTGMDIDPINPGVLSALAATTGAALVGLPQGTVLDAIKYLTPEMFGAVGYNSAAAALAEPDSTAAMQAMATVAGASAFSVIGNLRWYKVSTVSWSSNTFVQGVNCVVPNATTDNAPFFVDGQATPKENITFVDCNVNGNRIGQTNLTSSGGDGQRAGFKFFGRMSNVKTIRCSADYCATDGFFIWTGTVIPDDADDLLFDGLQIIDCNGRWAGRHGKSITSHRNTVFRGGEYKNNGKDLPGFTSGTYSDGGYGRRDPGNLSGILYGRPFTHEEFFLGEHYENWVIENVDARGNRGGPLLYHCIFPTVRSCTGLSVTGGHFDDPFGGVGDGAFITYAVSVPQDDGGGSRTVYTGTDAFDGVSLKGSHFGRNYVNLSNARNITFAGCEAPNITASQYSVIFTNCINVLAADVKSNKPQLGRPSPITNTSITLPAGWTAGTALLSTPLDAGTGLTYLYSVVLTPDGAGTEKPSFVFTAGYTLRPTFLSVLNNNTAAPVLGSLVPGDNGVNELDLWLSPADTAPLAITIGLEATPNP